MRAGSLRETITIQLPVIVKDVYGANATSWADVISTRANVTYNSGNRQNTNNEIINNYTRTFTIRYYHNINENMIIIWNGGRYRILSVERAIYKLQTVIITELINE